MDGVFALVRTWWSAPIGYGWLIEYVEPRGLLWPLRWLVAGCAGAVALVPFVMLGSPAGPDTTAERSVTILLAVGAALWAARWLSGAVPSYRQSLLFVAYSDVAITTACLLDTQTLTGMFGLNALTLLSVYVVFFHNAKVLVLHSLFALASLLVFAVQIAVDDPAMAAAKVLVAGLAIVGTPPFVQFGFWMFRTSADESLLDPLTGLLNRRGLYAGALDLCDPDNADLDVIAMTIDLDLFKQINDSLGHSVGDEVLVRTARRIKSVVRGTAVLARLGGEEFVLLDVMPRIHASGVAERIRRAIASPADRAPVTASVGVACVPVREFAAAKPNLAGLVDGLVAHADRAMYEAKEAGRDNVVVDLTTAALAPVALSDAGPVVTVRRPAPVTTWSGRYDRRAR